VGTDLALPVYDRAETHDPVPGACIVPGTARLVLVEGLFLCTGGDTIEMDVAASAASGSAMSPRSDEPALWEGVRRALDIVVFLDVPLSSCRTRAVRRKGLAGVSHAAAIEHFNRVDVPTFSLLQDWVLGKPPSGATEHLLRLSRADSEPASNKELHSVSGKAGADLVLRLSDAWPGTPGSTDDEKLAHDESLVLRQLVARTRMFPEPLAHPCPPSTGMFIVGLNPCVQRTLVFGRSSEKLGGGHCGAIAEHVSPPLTTEHYGWMRGGVNRADASYISVGGKGQHCALAAAGAARSFYIGDSGRLAVHLAMFTGGAPGKFVRESICTTSSAAPSSSASIEVVAADVGDALPTRTCITLVDRAAGDATELIEPSSRIPPEAAADLVARAANTLRCMSSSPARRYAVAVMGTAPPGAELVTAEILRSIPRRGDAYAGSAPGYSPPVAVLIDAYKGFVDLLRATHGNGAPVILKVNADELPCVVKEIHDALALSSIPMPAFANDEGRRCTDSDAPEPVPILRTTMDVVGAALWVLQAASLLQSSWTDVSKDASDLNCSAGLCAVGVTAGKRPAALVIKAASALCPEAFSGATSATALCFRYPCFVLPVDVSVASPIGAGDTVAGVCLAALVSGVPLPAAFGQGLAAATASCASWVGATWDDDLSTRIRAENPEGYGSEAIFV
jgi:fructose-1-phosphate kinase PfkB-like protein